MPNKNAHMILYRLLGASWSINRTYKETLVTFWGVKKMPIGFLNLSAKLYYILVRKRVIFVLKTFILRARMVRCRETENWRKLWSLLQGNKQQQKAILGKVVTSDSLLLKGQWLIEEDATQAFATCLLWWWPREQVKGFSQEQIFERYYCERQGLARTGR